MKSFAIVMAVLAGLIVAVGGVCLLSYVSAYNAGNAAEKDIVATYEDNQNILSTYGQKIAEAAQIPAMQKDDLTAIFTDTLEARYGKDGAQAGLLFIKEQNPNLDQKTYILLMEMISSGRTDFKNGQTILLDKKRAYETQLGSFWTGMWMRIADYPKITLADYKIIKTARSNKAFETGMEDGPIKMRP